MSEEEMTQNWIEMERQQPIQMATQDAYWRQARIQFVGQIASAIISNYEFYAQGIAEECKKSGKLTPEIVAQMSLEIADALIAELKKGGEDEND